MAAVTTWSAKIDDNEKERLQILIDESGLSSKDFLQNLITIYELNNTKIHVIEISQDITEIQQITQRINNIFINVAERIESIKSNSVFEKEHALAEKDNIIHAMTEKIDSLKSSLEDAIKKRDSILKEYNLSIERYDQLKSTYDRESAQITETLNNQQQLIVEYKEKIDKLSSIVIDYQDKVNKTNELSDKLSILENSFYNIEKENEFLKEKLSRLDKVSVELSASKSTIDMLEREKYTLERTIGEMKDKHSLDIEKTIISAEKSYYDTIKRVQDEYNKKLLESFSLLSAGNKEISPSPSENK